jgi:hypothetical protein
MKRVLYLSCRLRLEAGNVCRCVQELAAIKYSCIIPIVHQKFSSSIKNSENLDMK